MHENSKPKVNPDYIFEKIDDEILLYTEDGTEAVYLNDAAHAVWLICKENMKVGKIIDCLEQHYPQQRSQIRKDVITALKTLESYNVIEFSNGE